MTRLGKPEQRLAVARPHLALATAAAAIPRQQRAAWRQWYGLKAWKVLRMEVLRDALYTCAKCGRREVDTSKLVADHIRPHRGDWKLFADKANLQCLCKPCHDSAKQREEAAALWNAGI